MAFRWRVQAVEVADAIEEGTGLWEPFGFDPKAGTIFVKQLIEVEESEKATEVRGSLGNNW